MQNKNLPIFSENIWNVSRFPETQSSKESASAISVVRFFFAHADSFVICLPWFSYDRYFPHVFPIAIR